MSAFLYPNKDLGLSESHFELKKKVTTVGRHPTNDISLLLESVSRFHGKIEQQGDTWIVFDLNSSNGTFVNGERIASPRRVNSNDTVTFGRAEFRFALPEAQKPLVQGEDSTKPPSSMDHDSSSVKVVGEEQSA